MRLRAWLKNLGLILLSVLVAGLLAEIAMAALGMELDGSYYTADRVRGTAFRAGAKAWNVKEGRQLVVINSDALHDIEHPLEKPDDTLRIAVVGDSFSGAVEVAREDTYWHILEQKLEGCAAAPKKKIEVINFGVGGYGTAQELLTLQNEVWKYHPDVVLLQMYVGNDIFNNYQKLNDENAGTRIVTPYFKYDCDELVLDNGFLSSPTVAPGNISRTNFTNEIINSSRVLLMLYQARRAIVRPRGAPEGDARDLDPGSPSRDLFRAPASPDMTEAWKVTEGILAKMAGEVAEKGAAFWVMTVSHPVQVFPDAEARKKLAEKLGAPDLFYPDERIRTFVESKGGHGVALGKPMQAYVDAHPGVYLHGFSNSIMGQGHWNEDGHRVGGEILAEQMCAQMGESPAN